MTYKAAATWRAVADQGKTWSKTLIYKIGGVPFDNTGWNARMMVRRNYDSPYEVISLGLNAGITLGGANGEITFFVPADWMDDLAGNYVFDLELFDLANPQIVYGVVRGTLEVRREVTYG